MDSAILSALDMPEEERRHRMKTLRSVVKKFTVAAWGEAQQREFDAAVERKQEMLEKQE